MRAVSVREGTSTIGTYTTTIENPVWSVSGTDFEISTGGVLSFQSPPVFDPNPDDNNDTR